MALRAVVLAVALVFLVPGSAAFGTNLGIGGCPDDAAPTALATVPGVQVGLTGAGCSVEFGSAESTALLRISQSDGAGSALWQPASTAPSSAYGGGAATLDDGNTSVMADALVQPDGRIVFVGHTTGIGVRVCRATTAGIFDAGFGTNGCTTIPQANPNSADRDGQSVALQANGSIVVASSTGGVGGAVDTVVARLNSAGQLDPTFSGDGVTVVNTLASSFEVDQRVIVLRDGRIAVGINNVASRSSILALRADGQIDATFGTNGILAMFPPGYSPFRAKGLAIDHRGRLLVAGYGDNGSETHAIVVRVTTKGTLDTSFNGDGYASIDSTPAAVGGTKSEPIEVDDAGRILLGGDVAVGSSRDVFVARILSDGSLDSSFSSDGFAVVDAATGAAEDTESLMQQPDGRIMLAGGESATGAAYSMRFTGQGAVDTSFGSGGSLVTATIDDIEAMEPMRDGGYMTATVTASPQRRFHLKTYSPAPTEVVGDFVPGISDWSAGTSAFGGCLQRLDGTGVIGGWQVDGDGNCTAANTDPWNGIPGAGAAGRTIARSTTAGVTAARAELRFGARFAVSAAAGTYVAPMTLEVVAPDLTAPANAGGGALPAVTGTAQVRSVLSASTGTWTGTSPMSYTWQWQRCTSSGTGCTDIVGATAARYHVQPADAGGKLRVVVTATNPEGSASSESAVTGLVTSIATGMSLVTGFEHGTGAAGMYYSKSGLSSIATETVRNGQYALRVAPDGVTEAVVRHTVSTNGGAVARVAVNMERLPTGASYETILSVTPGGGGEIGRIQANGAGATQMLIVDTAGATLATTAGPTITSGRWYMFEVRVDASTSTWQAAWTVDHVSYGAITGASASTPALPTGSMRLRFGTYFNSNNYVAYYDDVAASSSLADYPLGVGKVMPLVPSASGTHVGHGNFTYNSGGGWTGVTSGDDNATPGTAALIDDWPVPDAGSTDLLAQTTNPNTGEYLEYAFTNSAESRPPTAVTFLGAHREQSMGTNNIQLVDVLGGTPDSAWVYSANISTGAAAIHGIFGTRSLDPLGNPWTIQNLDDIRVRLSSSDTSEDPWTDALMAEVDYPTGNTPVLTTAPSLLGITRVGEALTSTTGTWQNAPSGYSRRWFTCDAAGAGCSPITAPAETGSSYVLRSADAGRRVLLQVTAENDAGRQTATVLSELVRTATPTLVFMSGFESGMFSSAGQGLFTNVGGQASRSALPRNGQYAMLADGNGATAAYAQHRPASTTQVAAGHVAVRVLKRPSAATTAAITSIFSNTVARYCRITIDSAGTLAAEAQGGSTQPGPTLELDTWHTIEMRYDLRLTTWTCNWSVDGVAQPAVSISGMSTTDRIREINVGSTVAASVFTALFDDWAVSSTPTDYPLGPLKVDGYAPNATGTHVDALNFSYTVNNGTDSWPSLSGEAADLFPGSSQRLDDWPLRTGGSADAVRQTIAGSAPDDYLEYRFEDPEERTAPLAVSMVGAVRDRVAGANNVLLTARIPTGTNSVYSVDPAGTSVQYGSGMMATRPGGGAWTHQDLVDLTARIDSTDVTQHPVTDALLTEAAFSTGDVPVNTQAPRLYHNFSALRVGDALTADEGTWTTAEGSISYTYEWRQCDAVGTTCTTMAGETQREYTVQSADAGKTIRVVVTAMNAAGSQSRAGVSQSAIVATAPSLVYSTGFEHGAISTAGGGLFESTGGAAPAATTAAARSGTRGMNCTTTLQQCNVRITRTGNITVARIAVRYNSIPTGPVGGDALVEVANTASSRFARVEVSTSGWFTANFWDSSAANNFGIVGGPQVVLGRWYVVEARFDTSGATWTIDWSIDGATQPRSTYAFGSAENHGMLWIGAVHNDTVDLDVDDVAVSGTASDYPLGDGAVEGLSPDSIGALNTGFFGTTFGAALTSTSWQNVAEVPFTIGNGSIRQNLQDATQFQELGWANPADLAPINGVRGVLEYDSNTTIANTGETRIVFPDASVRCIGPPAGCTVGVPWAMNPGNVDTYAGTMLPAPTTGWSNQALSGATARIGYSDTLTTSYPRWGALMLEIDHRR